MITDVHTFDMGDGRIRVTALVDGVPTSIFLVRAVLATLNTQAEKRAVAAYVLRLERYNPQNVVVQTDEL